MIDRVSMGYPEAFRPSARIQIDPPREPQDIVSLSTQSAQASPRHSVKVVHGQIHHEFSLNARNEDELRKAEWGALAAQIGIQPLDHIQHWLTGEERVTGLTCRGIEVKAQRTPRYTGMQVSAHYSTGKVGSLTREFNFAKNGDDPAVSTEKVELCSGERATLKDAQPAFATVQRLCGFDPGRYLQEVFGATKVKPEGLGVSAQRTPSGSTACLDFSLSQGGRDIGSMTRTFTRGRTDSVHHDYFRLDDDKQAAGLAKSIMAKSVSFYEKARFSGVDVYASLDVGGYAWAKYGFAPVDSQEMARLSQSVRRTLTGLDLAPEVEGAVHRLLDNHDPRTIWTLSDLEMPVQRAGRALKLGQALLLGRSWEGRLDLNDPEARQRFQSYVGKEK